MALTGHLSEFSLPELFQFIEQGYKTGLLSIQTEPNVSNPQGQSHYIWIQSGRIMAMADGLDENCLLSMIQKRGWLSSQALSLLHECRSVEQPLGLFLKTQGAMSAEQLKLLFHAQVLRLVEEVPILAPEPKKEAIENTMLEPAPVSTKGTGLNQSFLQNLVGFLQTRVA